MQLVKGLIIACCCLLGSITACDQDKVNAILAQQSLNADFVQMKKIAALSRPLISKGQIWMSPEGQLIWQILKPLKSTMLIQDNSFKLFNKNDELQPDNRNALVKDISSLFLTLLSGDSEKLSSMFNQILKCDENSWHLELRPKEQKLSNLISLITLSGEESLTNISFQENRGDLTTIELSHRVTVNSAELEKYLVQ